MIQTVYYFSIDFKAESCIYYPSRDSVGQWSLACFFARGCLFSRLFIGNRFFISRLLGLFVFGSCFSTFSATPSDRLLSIWLFCWRIHFWLQVQVVARLWLWQRRTSFVVRGVVVQPLAAGLAKEASWKVWVAGVLQAADTEPLARGSFWYFVGIHSQVSWSFANVIFGGVVRPVASTEVAKDRALLAQELHLFVLSAFSCRVLDHIFAGGAGLVGEV